MAYAEKRGKSWRVRYQRPDATYATQSGFETKQAALAWGRDQESAMRRGDWTDPRGGQITLAEWVETWWPAQDVSVTTMSAYRWEIDSFILPAFGDRALASITTEEILVWEKAIVEAGFARSSAASARGRLHTILGDAVPRLIPYNPAVKPRARGRRTGRKADRGPEKEWATPLQVLLLAERCALLSGCDDDFIMIVTKAYTGMRWAEVIGLEREYCRLGSIRVEWQPYEHNGNCADTAQGRLLPDGGLSAVSGRPPVASTPGSSGLAARLSRSREVHLLRRSERRGCGPLPAVQLRASAVPGRC
jgi:integrase